MLLITTAITPRRAWEARVELEEAQAALENALRVAADPDADQTVAAARERVATARETLDPAVAQFGGRVYRVATHRLTELERTIDKLNRRAIKLQLPTITFAPVDVTIDQERIGGVQVCRPFTYVLIDGEAPRLDEWMFLAVLERDGGTTRLKRLVGTDAFDADLEPFVAEDVRCQHCHLKRKRRDTFLVGHSVSKVVLQVGSSCLKDFTGHDSPQGMACYAEMLAGLTEALRSEEADTDWSVVAGALEALLPTEEFMAFGARAIRTSGWVSRKTDRDGGASADRALAAYWRAVGGADDELPTDEDRELAAEVLGWIRGDLAARATGGYEAKLVAACQELWMSARDCPLVASAVPSYERERAAASAAPVKPSEHLGEIYERLEVEVTVTHAFDRAVGASPFL